MKVYELIAKLQKAKAGADVVVGMHSTLNAACEHVQIEFDDDDDCGQVIITGGDAELIDENGNETGLLSYHASVDEN